MKNVWLFSNLTSFEFGILNLKTLNVLIQYTKNRVSLVIAKLSISVFVLIFTFYGVTKPKNVSYFMLSIYSCRCHRNVSTIAATKSEIKTLKMLLDTTVCSYRTTLKFTKIKWKMSKWRPWTVFLSYLVCYSTCKSLN